MSERPRRRRVPVRWLTLAEAVAIAAVLISGLGLYNSWNMRADTPAPVGTARVGDPLTLRARMERDGARLAIDPVASTQTIQSQVVAFPSALGVAPVETTGEPRIDVEWIAKPLRKAMGDGGTRGDRRLPVLVTTRYLDGAAVRSDVSLYQLGYTVTEGGLLGGDHLRLSGLSLVARGAKDGRRRLDSMWRPAPR